MKRVILVDDSEESFFLVKKALGERVHLTWAKTVSEAITAIEQSAFDLVLLDVVLPDGDGFQLCARLQQNDKTAGLPIIFLTAKTGVPAIVMGISLGADDYIEKPFDPLELNARVEGKLNKARRQRDADTVLVRGDLQITADNQTVMLNLSNRQVKLDLTPIEFKLLYYLVRNEGRTYSRDQLMSAVWGENVVVAERTVDKHVSSLRQKLEHCSHYIETVPGFGYTFVPHAQMQKAG